jgi:hypothetical protein
MLRCRQKAGQAGIEDREDLAGEHPPHRIVAGAAQAQGRRPEGPQVVHDVGMARERPLGFRQNAGEEDVEVAGRAAGIGQLLGVGAQGQEHLVVQGAPEQCGRRPQPAQRHAGAVDAHCIARREHGLPGRQEVRMA